MNHDNYLLHTTNVICTVLLGIIFFFTIIGVFGMGFTLAGLLLFVIVAIAVSRPCRAKGTEV
jgi:hypothetical protein